MTNGKNMKDKDEQWIQTKARKRAMWNHSTLPGDPTDTHLCVSHSLFRISEQLTFCFSYLIQSDS